MVSEEKVKTMTRLAIYEQREGKKSLPVSKYYRTDYVGQALIRNLFLVTIGYVLIMAILGLYFSEYLMNNIHKMNLQALIIYFIAGYVILLVLYSIITGIIYNVRYFRAKKSVRGYYSQLTALDKLRIREEKKRETANLLSGGKKK